MARTFALVGVIGLGTMGAGIVEVFARSGIDVVAVEGTPADVVRGQGVLRRSTDRAVARGKLAEAEQEALHARVRFTSELTDLAGCDLVLEAVPEQLDLKREILTRLDAIVKPDAVLATNTSSLSVTQISVATQHPGRVVGMHFFNPAPVLRLVEVVRTVVTDDAAVEDVRALAEQLGKTPVVVGDKAGFIANALLFGYLNAAVSMYESGHASREDIDAALQRGCGLPMGPLALMDLIGLDTAHEILETMYQQGRDRLHAPSPVLRQMVVAGLKGRKSGRGFYTYEQAGSSRVVPDALTPPADSAGPSPRPVRSIGVVGSGVTAVGLVQALARAGYDVTHVARPHDPLEQLAGADVVVEAVEGDLAATRSLFADLDAICRPGAILATTTSSLPVIACAAATSRPQDVVGMHVLDPSADGGPVEVVHTVATAQDAVATAQDLCRRLGRHPVTCGDRAGFIVHALLVPFLNDAVRMLEAHYADVDDIDTAMTAGCGYPAGPFELLDEMGLDVALSIQRRLYDEVRERGLAPAPLLQQLVTAGHLGHKAGRGFRSHA